MATYLCQYGNCQQWGESSEMITVSGGGFRKRYCSWIHAAIGCISAARLKFYGATRSKIWPDLDKAESALSIAHKDAQESEVA